MARGFHRVIRAARTITDWEQSEHVARHQVGEAISFHNSAPAA
jgi:predicted ATPase with chaperone activity